MKYIHKDVKLSKEAIEWNRHSPKEILQYAIGALLYAPADHETVAKDICNGKYKALKNIVFCLEDAILDTNVVHAEQVLIENLEKIYYSMRSGSLHDNDLPLIFIRIRTPEQMWDIFQRMGEAERIITGFVLPKFDSSKVKEYKKVLLSINQLSKGKKYIMPALESLPVMDKRTRRKELQVMKEGLEKIKEYVLNIRVGGNDFCSFFGVRRGINNTIYDICVVKDVLTDIMNTFGMEYVVSAPVWEYFGEENYKLWEEGLNRELELDKLNGFVGKTAIHPSQLPVIQKAYIVDKNDYEDAMSVLHWKSSRLGVEKSAFSGRMNEVKIHEHWAKRILLLAKIYGVKE